VIPVNLVALGLFLAAAQAHRRSPAIAKVQGKNADFLNAGPRGEKDRRKSVRYNISLTKDSVHWEQ
jgi:hypothetical protein